MAGSKLERLIGIIFLLINREKMTAKELAEYFSVSIKTIYRDIETLSLANIPVTSYPGVNGGYGIIKTYIIDKNTFSYDDIVSALSVLGSIKSFFSDPAISGVAEKMTALIASDKKSELKKLAEEMVFDLSAWGDGEPTKRKLNSMRSAIQKHRLVIFNYTNRSGESIKRLVEPINILFKESAWYMKGYCRIRSGVRIFKLTRIRDLVISQEEYEPDISKYDKEKVEENIIQDDNYVKVTIKISPKIRVRVEDYIDAERIYEKNGELYGSMHYPDEEYLYDKILSFGDNVEVIEPSYLRNILRERALRVYNMYNKD